LTQIILASFAELTVEQVIERLDRAGIANAKMNEMNDVWNHAQLKARNRWREVDTPVGPVQALLPPGEVGVEPRMDPVPDLGEHSRALLAEVGYSEDAIAELQKDGVI
ncbi:MAG: CoA transferase, partial [Paracoccaceae bacterium]|nr:CoA transferase [Paracoccaceae bacterium]